MSRRRSISDIVAVIMLVIIAIAAAAVIYAWLSGLLGGVKGASSSVAATKLQITGVRITAIPSSPPSFNVTVYLLNPSGSAATSVSTVEVEFTNGTPICSGPPSTPIVTTTTTISSSTTTTTTTATATIPPSSIATVWTKCSPTGSIPSGTLVDVLVYTPNGYYASSTTTWP